jgi:hypothetical protein
VERPQARKFGLAEVVVGLFVALAFDGFGLMVGVENHSGKSTIIAAFTPPPGSEHRVEAVRTLARWRLAFESGLEPRYGAAQRRKCVHVALLIMV